MFVDFEKAFFNQKQLSNNIPAEILECLSEPLPYGFKYTPVDGEDGICVLTTEDSSIKLDVGIEIPEDLRHIELSTTKEILELMYRTQRKFKALTYEGNTIGINGKRFPLNEVIKYPLKNVEFIEGELLFSPPPFNPPFILLVDAESISKTFLFQRQPLADLKKSLFKSIDNEVFQITYTINEEDMNLNFDFKFSIENAKDVNQIVEELKLYHSFMRGTFKLNGLVFSEAVIKATEEDTAVEETIKYWERVKVLQEILGVNFAPEFPIQNEDIIWIEKLCRSFIDKKPYKEYVKVDKLTAQTLPELNNEELLKADNLMFDYTYSYRLEIWGATLNIYDYMALYNIKVRDIKEINSGNFNHDLLIEPTRGKRSYQCVRHFLTEEGAEKCRKERDMKEFQNAELINID